MTAESRAYHIGVFCQSLQNPRKQRSELFTVRRICYRLGVCSEFSMPELDGLKEETAYLKLWLGILIVTGIGLTGWLLRNFSTASWLLIGGGISVLFSIGFGCFSLHQRIEYKMDEIKRL